MLYTKTYSLDLNITITKEVLDDYIKLFWNDIFKPLHSNNPNVHLMLLCKVEFTNAALSYRTLANLRKVNYSDRDRFIDYLIERLGVLSDSYRVNSISKIVFTYTIANGHADKSGQLLQERALEYEVRSHIYNNLVYLYQWILRTMVL